MVPFVLPPSVLAALAFLSGPAAVQQQVQEFGDLQIKFTEPAEFNVKEGTATFTGAVEAKYGLTVITSRSLVIDYVNGKGTAMGGVELRDPEGFLTTDRLEFDWQARTGRAENVFVQVGNVRLRADTLTIGPDLWLLEGATATLSRRKSPKYEIVAERVRIHPGRYAVAEHVGMRLFGSKLGWLPEVRFDLDPRIEGFNLPSFAEKKGVGFGVSWNSSFLLNDHVALGAVWNTFPQRAPVYGLELIYMTSDPDKTFRRVKPHSDLGEHFGDGWFDNVAVKSPLREAAAIGSPRVTYAVATEWS
ncbi:MAG: LPS-assembly protein LptD, partial [Armatimonadetes bacterium]|nr:LPS-assembly protein LptD [Armatimonadota bacterium]